MCLSEAAAEGSEARREQVVLGEEVTHAFLGDDDVGAEGCTLSSRTGTQSRAEQSRAEQSRAQRSDMWSEQVDGRQWYHVAYTLASD